MPLHNNRPAKDIRGGGSQAKQDADEDWVHFLAAGIISAAVPNMHHIPILHDIALTLQPQRSLGASVGL